jgi:hypothetical protein
MNGYEKLKEISQCCSWLKRNSTLLPLTIKNTPLNYQMQNFKSEMQVKVEMVAGLPKINKINDQELLRAN